MTADREFRATALKRLKETYKGSKGVLLPRMERHVMKSIKDDPERSSDYMHPSDMSSKMWCGRHDYYRIIGTPVERSSKANPSFRMENVFAEGHAIHGKYQQWLWEMGCLYGRYRCKNCTHSFFALSPSSCPSCDSSRLSYKEYPLRRSGIRIEGHADAAVHLDGFQALVEIKSIGIGTLAFEAPRLHQQYLNGEKAEDIWFKINRPFGSHMRQGQLYLWMAWPRYEQIVFVYESKFHQQTKEFVVKYNPLLITSRLDTARAVTAALGTDVPPARPEWAESEESKVCYSCSYRKTCWGIKHGATKKESPPAPTIGVRRAKPGDRKRQLGAATGV